MKVVIVPMRPQRPEMKAPPDLDSILSELSTGNKKSVSNIDLSGDLSESDTDNINIITGLTNFFKNI